ncbi:MAG: DUF932 domain-containing protein [Verrucomicrobiota bacterium]
MNFTSSHRSSIARFSSANGASLLRSASPLSDEQIRNVAPSIFAEQAHGSRSTRYSYIPTSEVLASLRKEGFQPFMVQQGGSKQEEKRGFTKHLLRLRHASSNGSQVGDHFREIVLVNSHDGTSSYQLMAGIFRLVCSNGMVVGEGNIDEVRVKHTGDVIPSVIDGCIEILGRLPEVSEQVREWSDLRLTSGEQGAFARAALALKYDEDEPAPIAAEKLLTVKRREDEAPTLWNTLNTVQENTIRGGIGYTLRDEQGRRKQIRRTREVKGIEQNVKLNRGLWVLAQEMERLKSA